MKKLVTAACALAAGIAMADGVTSANTVGFTTNETVSGYNFVGVPFVNVGYNTANISQISIAGADGWGGEVLEVWDGDPKGVAGYNYYDPAQDPEGLQTGFYWADDSGAPVNVSFAPGQGFVLSGFAADLTGSIASPYTL
jgi:hypothetical protein